MSKDKVSFLSTLLTTNILYSFLSQKRYIKKEEGDFKLRENLPSRLEKHR